MNTLILFYEGERWYIEIEREVEISGLNSLLRGPDALWTIWLSLIRRAPIRYRKVFNTIRLNVCNSFFTEYKFIV